MAFPRPARGAETTCAASVGNAGLMTREPALPALVPVSRFALEPVSAGISGGQIQGRSLQRGLGFPSTKLCVYRCTACPSSGSKLLGEKAIAAPLGTVTPGPGLPTRVLECMHTQERKI